MSCKQWTLATATFVLLIISFWSFINGILLCMNKYFLNDIQFLIPPNSHYYDSIQTVKSKTSTTVTIVNTSLFVY